ncbi:DUF2254 domain-containing protein [Lewinella sp. IMCC34183]|uniref:DUF2254 domain-containing protein n=1 Tax=Lewinella sp. IMCC34183 TaxID=2248762 RepID=UPI000E275478|nr:DUF2254 family protein [Lewinella sp. IMCC34183]
MRRFFFRGRDLLRSIASLPALIFFAFVVVAFVQLATTDDAQRLPRWLEGFNIQDLDTIRTILAAVVTGVFTLTIFAYTMVMNVIDRSISSYSPRLLPLILAERYHQEILGVGAGTIAHSVILLLGVADPPDAARPPVLAAASAGFFAVVSLVLFIYFIHRVSRSIHVNVLLRKSFEHTLRRLHEITGGGARLVLVEVAPDHDQYFRADTCGYLDEVDIDGLCKLSTRIGAPLHLLARPGSFVFVGDPVVGWSGGSPDKADEPADYFKISANEPVDSYATGFRHLVEVSIKAASPAINDPATAMTAVNYLGQLFRVLTDVPVHNAAEDTAGEGRLLLNDWTYADLLESCFRQLRCYLDSDPWGVDVLRKNLSGVEEACKRADRPEDAAAARRELALLANKPD